MNDANIIIEKTYGGLEQANTDQSRRPGIVCRMTLKNSLTLQVIISKWVVEAFFDRNAEKKPFVTYTLIDRFRATIGRVKVVRLVVQEDTMEEKTTHQQSSFQFMSR